MQQRITRSACGVVALVGLATLGGGLASMACNDGDDPSGNAFDTFNVNILGDGDGKLTVTMDGQEKCSGTKATGCAGVIDAGKTAVATVMPLAGFEIAGWSGDDPACAGSGSTVTIVNMRRRVQCAVTLRPAGTGPKDAGSDGSDSGSFVAAPGAGYIKLLTSISGATGESKMKLSEAETTAETAGDDYMIAAQGLTPGHCSTAAWSPPTRPSPGPVGGDVGASVEVKDGTTTIAKLDRNTTSGLYIGGGSVPAFGKALSLVTTGNVITPSDVLGLLQTISAALEITEPASGGGAVLTRGQSFRFKWNSFEADTMVVTFPGNSGFCRLDPKTGQFDLPGTFTQALAVGTFQQALLFALTRRTVNVKIEGVDRSLRGYSGMVRPASYTVQ